jgi:hypothetical protein
VLRSLTWDEVYAAARRVYAELIELERGPGG